MTSYLKATGVNNSKGAVKSKQKYNNNPKLKLKSTVAVKKKTTKV